MMKTIVAMWRCSSSIGTWLQRMRVLIERCSNEHEHVRMIHRIYQMYVNVLYWLCFVHSSFGWGKWSFTVHENSVMHFHSVKTKFASYVGISSSPMVLSVHCQQISEHNTLMCAKREVEGEPESENARQFQDPHGTRWTAGGKRGENKEDGGPKTRKMP